MPRSYCIALTGSGNNAPLVFSKSAFPFCWFGKLNFPCSDLTPLPFHFLPLLVESVMPRIKVCLFYSFARDQLR